jgi:hypothetical protein
MNNKLMNDTSAEAVNVGLGKPAPAQVGPDPRLIHELATYVSKVGIGADLNAFIAALAVVAGGMIGGYCATAEAVDNTIGGHNAIVASQARLRWRTNQDAKKKEHDERAAQQQEKVQ